MKRSELLEIIRHNTKSVFEQTTIMCAVDAYSAASNGAKPIVSRLVCSLKYDHYFLKGTGIAECPECGENFLQTDG